MIQAEQANQYLKSKKIENWKEKAHEAVLKLDNPAKELGLILLSKHPDLLDDDLDWYKRDSIKTKLITNIITKEGEYFETPSFVKLFKILTTKEIGAIIPKALKRLESMMYLDGYDRRSFRAPLIPTLFIKRKVSFLENISDLFEFDISFKEYIQYLNYDEMPWTDTLYLLIAETINNDNEDIFQICKDIIFGDDEIGGVHRQIIKGLLASEKPEAWEVVEKLLLAAQRQEGLRQTVLESLDETSIGAMKHFLKVILDNNLIRFSSVVRAMDVWAGFGWDAPRQSTIKRCIELALLYLNDTKAAFEATASKDNLEVYMAFWATATGTGLLPALHYAEQRLQAKNATTNLKCTILYFLKETGAINHINNLSYPMLKDASQKVQAQALKNMFWREKVVFSDRLETLETMLAEWSEKPKVHTSFIFEWDVLTIDRSNIYASMLQMAQLKGFDKWRVEKHFKKFNAEQRERYTNAVLPEYNRWGEKKTEQVNLTAKQRDFALSVLKDRSSSVRETALQALIRSNTVEIGEAERFEELLTRTTANVRRAAIKLLMGQSTDELTQSVNRLLNSKQQMQRLAALDIGLQLKESEKMTTPILHSIQNFKEKGKITTKEQIILDNILSQEVQYTWENGLRLYNPKTLSQPTLPIAPDKDSHFIKMLQLGYKGLSMSEKQVITALKSLEALIEVNKDYEYETYYNDNTKEKVLLGNSFRRAKPIEEDKDETEMEELQAMPLYEIWIKWMEDSKLTPLDLQLIIASYTWNKKNYKCVPEWHQKLRKEWFPEVQFYDSYSDDVYYKYFNQLESIVKKLAAAFPPSIDMLQYAADATAYYYTHIPKNAYKEVYKDTCYSCPDSWRRDEDMNYWLNQNDHANAKWSDEVLKFIFNLKKWRSHHSPEGYFKPDASFYFELYKRGFIVKDEIYEHILRNGSILKELTDKNSKEEILQTYPFLTEMVDECRDRILEIELQRGDTPTLVTERVNNLGEIFGIDNLVQILQAFGKDNFHRGYIYSWRQEGLSKKESLSKLLGISFPLENETFKDFSKKINAAKISEKRLIELAMYAPQWLKWVAQHLNWKGLEMATWWLHAHTNEYHDKRKESEISKYSAITMNAFRDGAVDVNWFKQAYKLIGKKRWEILYGAAKYISDGTGHRRAQLYADAILGKLKMREVKTRIKDKRNKDYVRLFGLMKLASRNPQKDLLTRYEMLQAFLKSSKQFGAQRQTSEKLAVSIAMDNLSRTAGFSDPIRLTWAMEARAASAIFEQGTVVEEGGYRIELLVDEHGKASILSSKDGEALKSIPAKFKKNKEVLRLKAHHKKLKDQYSRSRKALEEAMVRGDEFTQAEINDLMQHPVIAPMFEKLLFAADTQLGFWHSGQLHNKNNTPIELSPTATIHIAHCTDLQKTGEWASFQKLLFERKIVQPFKQVFRELYVPTPDELQLNARSERYAGYQVQPKKALALLKSRGWVVDYESGLQKVFHKEGFIAKVYSMIDWYTAADVESPTLESIEFHYRDNYKNVPFGEIEPRIFSEVMRDLDLVVSVAHAGGVDPEASLSTIELRKVLLEESMRLFKIKNITTKGNHAFIKGALNDYSVHLGSAIVHRQPGGYLAIIPVHSQHRGRIFLPFTDEDPKSAELISKVLLLAKDKEIKDPTILRQLG